MVRPLAHVPRDDEGEVGHSARFAHIHPFVIASRNDEGFARHTVRGPTRHLTAPQPWGKTPTMRTVWLNGEFLPEDQAKVSVFDRGLLFAQGVYEVSPVLDGKFRNWPHHAARLERSKALARITDDTDWPAVLAELIARNGLTEGRVYLQITGGAPADRDFLSPVEGVPATRFAFTQDAPLVDLPKAETGLKVMLHPEGRWSIRSAKTTQLLYAVLAKEAARDAGYDDAWLVDNRRAPTPISSMRAASSSRTRSIMACCRALPASACWKSRATWGSRWRSAPFPPRNCSPRGKPLFPQRARWSCR